MCSSDLLGIPSVDVRLRTALVDVADALCCARVVGLLGGEEAAAGRLAFGLIRKEGGQSESAEAGADAIQEVAPGGIKVRVQFLTGMVATSPIHMLRWV